MRKFHENLEEFIMRIEFNGCQSHIYIGEYSTGKRICNDFEARLTKLDSLQPKIVAEANRCRASYNNMLHAGYYEQFVSCHKLTIIIGESLKEKLDYKTYTNLNEFDKAKFSRIISKIILKSEVNLLNLSSGPYWKRDYACVPFVYIHLGSSMTKNRLNDLIDHEFQKENSKLKNLGIRLKFLENLSHESAIPDEIFSADNLSSLCQ